MSFNVEVFVNRLINDNEEQRVDEFKQFELAKLDTSERNLLFKVVNELYNSATKSEVIYPHITFLLGYLKLKGIGCPADGDRAYHLFNKVRESSTLANNQLEAKKLVDKAIKVLSEVHQSYSEDIYESSSSWIDYKAAIPLLTSAIKLDDVLAMVLYAELYEAGHGVDKNYLKAIELYKKAVAQENTRAMVNLALMYEQGHGTPVLYKKAAELNKMAAKLGNVDAMVNLARIYRKGSLGTFDYAAACHYYDLAIKLGSEDAIIEKAQMYKAQEGLQDKNGTARAALYELGMSKGYDRAVNLRAEMYKLGEGGPVSLVKYRALYCLHHSSYKQEALPSEDVAVFEVLTNGGCHQVSMSSICGLTEALQFLNQLNVHCDYFIHSPDDMKGYILEAVNIKLIPNLTMDSGFHKKICHLSGQSIYGLFYLLKEHARANYDQEGQDQVEQFVSYETIANLTDPSAQSTLKKLAQFDDAALYWAGISFLKSDKSAGFFQKSDYQTAVHYFQLAAAPKNKDSVTRELAQEKLDDLKLHGNLKKACT